MNFNDKKYLYLENSHNRKIKEIEFEPYQIGFPDSYDNVSILLTIEDDNSLTLDFTGETLQWICHFNVDREEYEKLLFDVQKQLLRFPHPTREFELIFT